MCIITTIIKTMKKDIHPEYYKDTSVKCACGNTFTVGSTRKEIKVEICYKCHPFYTGEGKLIDTAGRVEKFQARMAKAKSAPKKVKKTKTKKSPRDTVKIASKKTTKKTVKKSSTDKK